MDLRNISQDRQTTPGDSQSITFLPINQKLSPKSQRARRGYQSCDSCREKKKKCVPSSGQVSVCLRCQQESLVCQTTYPRKRRKLRPDTCNGPHWEALKEATSPDGENMPAPVGNASKTTRQPGSRSHAPVHGDPKTTQTVETSPNAKERILSTHLLDACDTLDFLAATGSNEDMYDDLLTPVEQPVHSDASVAAVFVPRNSSLMSRSSDWDHFCLVKRGIVTGGEITEYLDFYFSYLWHMLPVIPEQYTNQSRYALLSLEEPVLLISLIALASRYHPLSGPNGPARSERVHWRTWPLVQSLFQSALWGSSRMRRPGAIAALLLFIEWHCKAINLQESFLGEADMPELFGLEGEKSTSSHHNLSEPNMTPGESTNIHQRTGKRSVPESLNIVTTAYKSNKISRMLLTTAISLAQEIGCLDQEPLSNATLINQINEKNSVQLEWKRILYTFIRLADENLALRLRLEPQMAASRIHEVVDQIPPSLMADGFWESAIELTVHAGKARELLRSSRQSELGVRPAVPITAWESFRLGLDRWKRQQALIRNESGFSLRGACLDLEFFYIRLCGLSPTAHMFDRSTSGGSEELYKSSLWPFAQETTRASVDILHCAIHALAPSTVFQYIGVRYWLYIVCASLFLLKETLKAEDPPDTNHPNIRLICQAVQAIKQNAPDDIHMSQRYALLVDFLVKVAVRSSSSPVADQGASPTNANIPSIVDHTSNTSLLDLALDQSVNLVDIPNFWDYLPDVVGLDDIPNCFIQGPKPKT